MQTTRKVLQQRSSMGEHLAIGDEVLLVCGLDEDGERITHILKATEWRLTALGQLAESLEHGGLQASRDKAVIRFLKAVF